MAMEALCRQIEAPLFSYALRLVRNRSEAEDTAQEALFRLYRAVLAGRCIEKPRAYAFAIAHNLAVEYHRKSAAAVPPPGNECEPAPAAERTLLREQINLALAALPESQRAAVGLREFGQLSYAEIAEILGASLSQVKVWIHRARVRLAELLDRDGQYIGGQTHPLLERRRAEPESRAGDKSEEI